MGSGVDGVVEGDAEAVPVVKVQRPNVIGRTDKDSSKEPTCNPWHAGFSLTAGAQLFLSLSQILRTYGKYPVPLWRE